MIFTAYSPTKDDYLILNNSSLTLHTTCIIYNNQFQKIDEIQGQIIDGNLTLDADSDIRRTCNLSIHVNNKFTVNENSYIWLNKYIEIFIGIKSGKNKIMFYPFGIYNFTEYSYQYDVTTNDLSLSCVDLMSTLNGTRNGVMHGLEPEIPVIADIETNKINTIYNAIIGLLKDAGVKKYYIDFPKDLEIPYDQKFNAGDTYYTAISTLSSLYPDYEIFFHTEGTFVMQPIPVLDRDEVVFDFSERSDLIVSENFSGSFSDIYNVTEIFGQSLDCDRFSETATFNSGSITLDLSATDNDGEISIYEPSVGSTVGFTVPELQEYGGNLNIAMALNGKVFPIYQRQSVKNKVTGISAENKPMSGLDLKSGNTCIIRFAKDDTCISGYFYYLGEFQVHAVCKTVLYPPSYSQIIADKNAYGCNAVYYTVDENSPFAVEKIGEIRNVLSGGDYDNIYSNDLAIQRAKYENKKSTQLQDKISFVCFLVPWLGVNQKIRYWVSSQNKTRTFITKKINYSIKEGTMQIEASAFFPLNDTN